MLSNYIQALMKKMGKQLIVEPVEIVTKYVKMDRKYLIPAEELEKYFNNLSNSKN